MLLNEYCINVLAILIRAMKVRSQSMNELELFSSLFVPVTVLFCSQDTLETALLFWHNFSLSICIFLPCMKTHLLFLEISSLCRRNDIGDW